MTMQYNNQVNIERQMCEIQRARAQIVSVEQQISELELDCKMNEMSIGSIHSKIDSKSREAIEIKSITLRMLRTDLATREKLFALSTNFS